MKILKTYSSKGLEELGYPSTAQIEHYKKMAVQAMIFYGLHSKSVVEGLCAIVTVKMWELLGKPKDLVPYSCMVGEDEHVVLRSTKKQWILDPTGDQFNYNFYHPWAGGDYKKFYRLSAKEIQDIRDEGLRYQERQV